ncbi:MAG TPA: DUF1080 domain-containing protein [Gemmatimonadales bacterium]|jgi:hypothetical protein|nr:DUF1080 domain-containing protein [Gemmatimonadales bacterium]
MFRRALIGVAAVTTVAACSSHNQRPKAEPLPVIPEPTGPNTLTAAERKAGWELLFDGRTLTGWHTYQLAPGVTKGWAVRDGAIERVDSLGDLVTDLQFGNFELDLEWKISAGGNSGILWWGNEGTQHIYENAPEMQVLDNLGYHPDGDNPLTVAGALYGLAPAPKDAVKPVGEWNAVRIITHGGKVELWLNGLRTADVNFDSPDMRAKIKASKFNAWLSFAKSRRGHIALQDHSGTVWYRNIRIKDADFDRSVGR